MKVEILTDFRHGDHKYTAGDVVTVDDTTGAYFCRASWAKDAAGKVATGKPTDVVTLDVHNITIRPKAEKVNG